MKNKTSLLLMEQLVMVLIFALAAALCMTAFVKADQISRETVRRDEAVLLAQNAAQVLKATSGDTERAAQVLDADAADIGYRLEIERMDSETPLLGQAEVRIWLEEELVFTLRTGWQEVAE